MEFGASAAWSAGFDAEAAGQRREYPDLDLDLGLEDELTSLPGGRCGPAGALSPARSGSFIPPPPSTALSCSAIPPPPATALPSCSAIPPPPATTLPSCSAIPPPPSLAHPRPDGQPG